MPRNTRGDEEQEQRRRRPSSAETPPPPPPPGKRQRRHVRSRNGCVTCKQRKVKCDEGKPVCQRCAIESRQCLGYEVPSSSSERDAPARQPSSTTPVSSTPMTVLPRTTIVTSPVTSTSVPVQRSNHALATSPPEYASQTALDTLLSSLWGEALPHAQNGEQGNTAGATDWLADGVDWMVSRQCTPPPPIPQPSSSSSNADAATMYHGSPAAIAAAVAAPSMPPQHALLQAQLEAACSSSAQLAGVTQFFNHVAQCFHLIPVEANRWRSVFGHLCLQSDIVLRLVTAIGMVSLSYLGTVNHRPAAYGHMTYALNAWKHLVEQGRQHNWQSGACNGDRDAVTLHALQVLAVPILVGHVEQFDVGVDRQTNACMAVAKETVVKLISQHKGSTTCLVEMGPSSAFRFLTRILLWWDTFSGSMGTGAGGPDADTIFDAVRAWEQNDDDDDVNGETTLDSTQCVTSWPLDLLEAVARTTKLAKELRASERGGGGDQWLSYDLSSRAAAESSTAHNSDAMDRILSEARGIEMQIRSCRPHIVLQDSARASELRFIVFEIMQAGTLIYFSRVLCGDTVHVAKEVERVIQFFIRSDVASSAQREERSIPSVPPQQSQQQRFKAPPGRPSEWRHAWAADVAVIWSTMQAVIAVKPSRQDACRRVMRGLREQGDCGALDVWIELIEEIWLQRRRLDSAAAEGQHLNGIWDTVMAQRRWKQLFVF